MSPRSTSLGRSKLSVQLQEALRHPIDTAYRVRGRLELSRERGASYEQTPAWDEAYHRDLSAPWPCPDRERFEALWRELESTLKEIGHGHDADPVYARAAWCAVRHLSPTAIVELGVARGVSTRFVLEALGDRGRLWSVDLPPLLEAWRAQVGVAVPETLRSRWSYVRGPGRRVLPRVLAEAGTIDIVMHDGLHTQPTLSRELGMAWSRLRPGGVALVDGIHRSVAFGRFLDRVGGAGAIVAPHERKRGFLGIVVKPR